MLCVCNGERVFLCCFLVNANVRKKKVREGGFVPKFPSRHTCSTQSPHSYSTDTTPTRLHSSLRLFFFFFLSLFSFREAQRQRWASRLPRRERRGAARTCTSGKDLSFFVFPGLYFPRHTSTYKKKKVKKRETDSKDPFIFFLGGRGSESRFHYLTTKRKKRKKTAFFYLLPFRCFDRWRLLSLSFLIKCF